MTYTIQVKQKDAIISVAMQNAYHPVRDYLNKNIVGWT